MKLEELTIKDLKNVVEFLSDMSSMPSNTSSQSNMDGFAIGKYVIIRTYSAGVWCGLLENKAGNEVILRNARRMWFWKCAKSISLSGIVMYGINQKESKIAPPVEFVWLEAIEIMPIKGDPLESIAEAPYAEA